MIKIRNVTVPGATVSKIIEKFTYLFDMVYRDSEDSFIFFSLSVDSFFFLSVINYASIKRVI